MCILVTLQNEIMRVNITNEEFVVITMNITWYLLELIIYIINLIPYNVIEKYQMYKTITIVDSIMSKQV